MQLGDARPPPRLPGLRDSKGGRVTSRKIHLHARTREGERAERFFFGRGRPATILRRKERRKKKKEVGAGERGGDNSLWGVGTVRKVDRVTQ